MPKSEIDDIFAAKGAAASPPVASSLPKKKKTKKRRRDESESAPPALSSSSSKVVPVTVIDSSSLPPPPSKRVKKAKVKSAAPKGVSKAEDSFTDSRGSNSRRTTEEGWSIYKEDELGMSKEGGDTPLCPFDCDCLSDAFGSFEALSMASCNGWQGQKVANMNDFLD